MKRPPVWEVGCARATSRRALGDDYERGEAGHRAVSLTADAPPWQLVGVYPLRTNGPVHMPEPFVSKVRPPASTFDLVALPARTSGSGYMAFDTTIAPPACS